MFTPVPPSIAEQADALRHVSCAVADAIAHNANPYRAGDDYIDINAMVRRLLELHLGPAGPEPPGSAIDPFSALVGAATVLAISLRHGGSTAWITEEPQTS